MASTTTTHAALLKTHYYSGNVINDLTLGEDPALAMLERKEDAGKTNAFPIITGNNQSSAADFATSQGIAGNLIAKQWTITMAKHYNTAQIDGDLIAYSKNDMNMFIEEASASIDASFQGAARRSSLHLFREGWGDLGQVTETSGTTATLASASGVTRPDWARNFEEGMVLQFADDQNASTLRDSGDTLTVTAVNEDAGTITLSATLANISGIAAYDFMFPKGERENSATPSRLVMSGFGAWLPSSAPSSTAFFGVDRTSHVTRLGGQRYTGTSVTVRQALRNLAVKISAAGGKPTDCYIGFDRWNELASDLGSQVEYADIKVGAEAAVSFRSIVLNGPKGPIRVTASNACPEDRAYMIQRDTWKLLSAGRAIGFLDEDNLKMLRQGSSDGYEVRIGGYHQLACTAPGWNGVATLAVG
jgi:hypothetical protein